MKIKKIKWDSKRDENGRMFGTVGDNVVGVVVVHGGSVGVASSINRLWRYGRLLMGGEGTSPTYTNTVKGISPEQRAKNWVEKEFNKYVSKFLED
jgi:hypothetical protein